MTLNKETVSNDKLLSHVVNLLEIIQNDLFSKAKQFVDQNIRKASNIDELSTILDAHGGFVEGYWNGAQKQNKKIKDLTKATIRCIPMHDNSTGKCILTGDPNAQKVIFARAY